MNYDQWLAHREEWFRHNPVKPEHLRLDIELTFPRVSYEGIPVEFNPHGHGQDARHAYYVCDDWTLRTPLETISPSPHKEITLRTIVESGHKDDAPRIRLISTSSSIVHESWAARKNWNDFAYHNGVFWRVTWNEFFGEWPGGRMWGLPFQDRRHYDDVPPSDNPHRILERRWPRMR